MKKVILDMKGIEWQGCTAHTLQKGLVLVKKLIIRVKRLIEFFMCPKQSERLEDIQKKYSNASKIENDENMEIESEQEEYINFNTLNDIKKLLITYNSLITKVFNNNFF